MSLPDISTLSGLSTNGVNVWGDQASIKAVMRAMYNDSIIDDVRTQTRHWREECGKVHAHRLEMLDVLKRAIAVWDAEVFDEAAADAVLKAAVETVSRMEARS